MEKTKKDIAAIDVPAKDVVIVSQYDRLIESGFNSNADLERMERLFELKKLHEENEARKEYFKAMAEFKKDPPLIKLSKIGVLNVEIKYAPEIIRQIEKQVKEGLY